MGQKEGKPPPSVSASGRRISVQSVILCECAVWDTDDCICSCRNEESSGIEINTPYVCIWLKGLRGLQEKQRSAPLRAELTSQPPGLEPDPSVGGSTGSG